VARGLAAADARVTVIEHDVNRGHIQTYNDGIAAVETPYFTLVSADDLVAPGALARASRLLDRHPRVGLVYGHPVEFEDGREPAAPGRSLESWSIWRGREWLRLACWRGRNFILSPEAVVRTAVYRGIGGYNPELPHSGDLEYWLRAAARWDVARVNGPAQAFYRVHGQNMHLTVFAGFESDLAHRAAAFDVIAREGLVDPASARRLLGMARRAMARERRGHERAAARLASGRTPAPWLRAGLDRARWRLWRAVGIS
jgi:hypothetical protein